MVYFDATYMYLVSARLIWLIASGLLVYAILEFLPRFIEVPAYTRTLVIQKCPQIRQCMQART